MIKDRVIQLIYRIIFLTLSLLGLIESFGLFANQKFGFECLIYYTTLSNLLCFIVMIIVSVQNVKDVKNKNLSGCNEKITKLKFYSTIAILVTFLVYNILLTDNMFHPGWNNLGNLTKHIFCPLLFVFDFILFDKHHSIKWYDCLLCAGLPMLYVLFILVRGALLPADFVGTIYPYFFLNVSELGLGGVLLWVLILFVVFILIAGLFYLYDKIEIENKKLKFYLEKKSS